jgi:hypothetical protein
MSTDRPDPILDQAADGKLLDPETLGRAVSRRDPAEFIDAFIFAPGLEWGRDNPRPAGYLEIHGRRWVIDPSDASSRPRLLAVITAAALADALDLPFSTAWVTRALPGALAVRSVTIDESGAHITVERLTAPALPPSLAQLVHPQDYAEFVEAIANAGTTVPVPAGGEITFMDP